MPRNVVDRKIGVPYTPELALRVVEEVAEGRTLVDLASDEGMPTRQTLYRWLTVYPKFYEAYQRAKEVSATSLEEEALTMARTLKGQNDFTGTKVQAYNIAMQQLRWSAARRNRAEYGEQTKVGNIVVPIQINTSLNMGQEGMPAPTDNEKSIYTVEVEVNMQPDYVDETDDSVMSIVADAEVIDLTAEVGDDEKIGFDLPTTEHQDLHLPKNGRPVKTRRKRGHKTPGMTAASAARYAKKETE